MHVQQTPYYLIFIFLLSLHKNCVIRVFHKLDETGTRKKKNPLTKCYLPVKIEPRPLINL